MAALLGTGMDPMLAIRLPTILATMGSVLVVYGRKTGWEGPS